MEKEYHLISAISSIYLSNLLIHPQDDTWEPIVQSERMKAITNGVLSAKAMLEKFNTECVAGRTGRNSVRLRTSIPLSSA